MNSSFRNMLLVAIVIVITAATCISMPNFSITTLMWPLWLLYSLLLSGSLILKNQKGVFILLVCGSMLPLSEILWNIYFLGFNDTFDYIAKGTLCFSFAGIFSYSIVIVVLPVVVFFIGNAIRKYRKA